MGAGVATVTPGLAHASSAASVQAAGSWRVGLGDPLFFPWLRKTPSLHCDPLLLSGMHLLWSWSPQQVTYVHLPATKNKHMHFLALM